MKKIRTLFLFLVLVIFSLFLFRIPIKAYIIDSDYEALIVTVESGEYLSIVDVDYDLDFTKNAYKLEKGGYVYYRDLWNRGTADGQYHGSGAHYFSAAFDMLKERERLRFIEDVFTIANQVASDTTYKLKHGGVKEAQDITDETVTAFMEEIANETGLGTNVLASILQQAKPNFARAHRILAPFSGKVGTLLGLISIIIMACLGISMTVDLAYINIPAFQVFLTDIGPNTMWREVNSKTGATTERWAVSRVISRAALRAVNNTYDKAHNENTSKDVEEPMITYFRLRTKELVILGICFLYLIQGELYSFVSYLIDLLSGFLDI